MSFTKNEAVILAMVAMCLCFFGELTSGTLSTTASIVGGALIGVVLMADATIRSEE